MDFFGQEKKDDVRCSKAIDSLENEYVGMYSVSKMEFSIPICFEKQVWKIQALYQSQINLNLQFKANQIQKNHTSSAWILSNRKPEDKHMKIYTLAGTLYSTLYIIFEEKKLHEGTLTQKCSSWPRPLLFYPYQLL